MFTLRITHPELGERRLSFERREVRVGAAADNDVVLEHAGAHHARLLRQGGAFVVIDLSGGRTAVDGRPIRAPTVLHSGETLNIGPYGIGLFEGADPRLSADPVEAAFLAAIDAQPRELQPRLVYEDWLEESGQIDKAELMRLSRKMKTLATDDPELAKVDRRLRALHASTDAGWRALVADPVLENCPVRFSVRCPMQWEALRGTDVPGVRHCDACDRSVHYCTTVRDLEHHALRGNCVAVDLAVPRRPGDLTPPPPPMAGMVRMP